MYHMCQRFLEYCLVITYNGSMSFGGISMQGVVKIFNKNKGFGFITTRDGEDVFFHYSHLIMEGFKTVEIDTEVEFELIESDRGKQAHNIIRIA